MTKTYNWASSQAAYGILQKQVDNKDISALAQTTPIYTKYNRFLSYPTEFLGDGIPADLDLGVDFGKYILINDELAGQIVTYKLYEYEFMLDIENQVFDMTIHGRTQNYSQY